MNEDPQNFPGRSSGPAARLDVPPELETTHSVFVPAPSVYEFAPVKSVAEDAKDCIMA